MPLEPRPMDAKHIYQKYLKDEFERRKQRNSSCSLRAYARDLEIPSSKLSQYFSGDCGISAKKASEIARKLHLGPLEEELFVCSAEASHARDALSRDLAQTKLKKLLENVFSNVNMEKFNLIRDWYHLAILELTEVDDFQSNLEWIAGALGVDVTKVTEAVQRLERLELLDSSNERWVQTLKDFETPQDISSRAIRDYHRQMMGVVESRIEEVPIEKRELGSMVFAVDKELVPEFKQLIRRFQKEAATLSGRSLNKDSVYALNLQFMPIFEGEKP